VTANQFIVQLPRKAVHRNQSFGFHKPLC